MVQVLSISRWKYTCSVHLALCILYLQSDIPVFGDFYLILKEISNRCFNIIDSKRSEEFHVYA